MRFSPGNQGVSDPGGAESGARGAPVPPIADPAMDANLAEVVARWPALSEATRAGIGAIVRAATGSGPDGPGDATGGKAKG